MGNDVTGDVLWARALDYADMTGTSFPDSTRKLDYLNEGLGLLYDMLVASHEDYLLRKTTIEILAGTAEYPLPSDFYKATKVFLKANDRLYPLERFELDEVGGLRELPIDTGTIELWYIPTAPRFTASGQKISQLIPALPTSWETSIAYHAAAQLLLREETAASEAWASKAQRELVRLAELAEERDGEPPAVADYYGRWPQGHSLQLYQQHTFKYHIFGQNIRFAEISDYGV